MKIHREYLQGSPEWMAAHVGVTTASEFDQLVTPGWEIRKGQTPQSYLARKVAEAWSKAPMPGFGSWQTEQGTILEGEAIPWYEFEYRQEVDRVGFCLSDCERFGCSPDGLLGADGGIEIKCPNADTHVGYLLANEIPKAYLPQVHGSLFVTGRKWWRFLSYRRRFPPLIIDVQRDEAIMEVIAEALALFLARFDAAMKYLRDLAPGLEPQIGEGIRFSQRNDHVFESDDVPCP